MQVEHLESSLDRALKRIDELESSVSRGDKSSDSLLASAHAATIRENEVDIAVKEISDARLELPPLQQVLSATEVYLTTLNAVLPLFHPGRLLQLIKNWYEYPGRSDHITWAAINVILALAHRRIPRDGTTLDEGVAHYLQNAQTVLSEVTMGEVHLLNVQIVLGMVLLFQGTQDLKPATMLIAVALRLAHELGLHTRRAEGFDASHVLERDRVFWIAYILDRDISMRTSRPPVQRETDIDLDWPSAEPDNGAGSLTKAESNCSLSFLQCRVSLARIQGEVFDFMVATRAGTIDDYQRDKDTVHLNHMLDDWMSSIPPPFRRNSVLQTGQQDLCRSIAVLYATHLASRSQVYRAHAMASRWMQSLRSYGKTVTQDGHVAPVPLPTSSLQDWEKIVEESRGFMQLFWAVEQRDQAFIWFVNCVY